ncbi:hypothetical protein PAMP_024494 [Pampus punctatissimus]
MLRLSLTAFSLSWTLFICNVSRGYAQERLGYLVAAPSVFRAGVEESVSVTIFNAKAETRVQVQLSVKGQTVAHSHGSVFDKGTIKLKVPSGLRGQAHLKVWGNRHLTEGGYIFHNYTTVTVESKGTAVFIQTDKPVYKPKHKVLINIYTVTPDLRPVNDKDPRGSRMVQWKSLKSVCCGVVNMSFPLSDQPVFGEWFIFVEMQGHTYNKSFVVQKYVMPKFELVIDPPRYIRDLNSCEQATVMARYTFGKPVTGKLTVNMTVNGVGYYRHEMGHHVIKTMEIKGSANFSLCVKEMMPLDVADHFRGTVSIWASVTSIDGSRQTTFDDSTPVHKQLIDIKYSKDTRKQFKPGLPYKGKIEVTYPDGSLADGVRVRVKAELTPKDNVYTSELISKEGQATFEIPSIPTAAQYVWLEVGQEAEVALKSTCPCNFTLHYEVASRGNIMLSGQQSANLTALHRGKRATVTFDKNVHTTHLPPSASGSSSQAEMDSCVSYLRFPVSHSMAPLSRLLVYYVRENGEGVTDSLQIPIQPDFENQVSVSLSANESMPGDPVTLHVRGERGSCVCVATVDRSLYLLKPDFQLSPDKVFKELADFDVSDAFGTPKDDGHFWWPGLSSKRRRRSSVFPWHWDITKDARFAFTETGLVVMTDMVSLNHRQSGGMYTDEAVPAFQPHTSTLVAAMHSRSTTSAETGEADLRLDVPDSITTWVAEAIGLSEEKGLGIAKRVELRTFKPFFVDFTLPYSLIRGEQTKVPLTVYNYLPTCSEVHVKVSVPKGIKFVGHPGKHHLTRKKCVAPGEATPTSIVLSFTELGSANITARAIAYSEPSCCSDGLQTSKIGNEVDERRTPTGLDYVRRTVLVEPEGLPREYTYSVFFCPNERIHISTPNKYEYQYVKKPAKMNQFQVAVKTHNDAHFALSASPHDSAEMLEIVLGGRQNTRSWISLGKMGELLVSASTPGILSWDEFRSFWISWKGGLVQLRAAKSWLIKHQRDEGSFPAMGRILNKDLQGGIHGKISLTAYVVAALLETGITTEEEKVAVAKAKDFLESNTYSADDPYTTALSAYALALLRSPYGPLALRRLNHMAITQDGLTHWSLTGSTMTDEDTFMGFSDGLSQSVVSAEVEMTAYGLLTYTLLGDVASALPVVKWLSQQRNALGGFSSTQDTCVALQALSEYAILSYVGGVNLTISLASTNLDFQETFELNKDNKKLLQSTKIPSIPTGLFVSAKGEGCCLMQIDVSYNVPDPVSKPAFQLKVDLKEPFQERHLQPPSSRHPTSRSRSRADNRSELNRKRRAPIDDDDPAAHQDKMDFHISLEVCARWLHSGSSNMAVIEVPMISGFRADVESLERLLMDKRVGLKRYELNGRKVLFYFDEIPSQCMTCVAFQAVREYIVGKTAPVPVKIYDYYEPAFEATRFYNVSESSPLARELCDGPTCNEVESSTNQWIVSDKKNVAPGFVQASQCNNVFGCLEEEQFERCTCYRDCGYDGEPVCGSDGQLYQNQCQMEVFACRNGTRIKQVPLSQCPHSEEEQGSMAEVSYYSYEYDPDTEPFLADAEGGDHFDLPEGRGDVEQKVLLPADTQLPTLDTRNSPERW